MNPREHRLGENEILYREVNERVRDLQEGFGLDEEPAEFVCECARLECTDRIRMTLADYEQVRADPTHFVVRAGHDEPEVETVVEDRGGYVIVEKDPGGPAKLAAAADPRRG